MAENRNNGTAEMDPYYVLWEWERERKLWWLYSHWKCDEKCVFREFVNRKLFQYSLNGFIVMEGELGISDFKWDIGVGFLWLGFFKC